jgi:hypothetical protein
MGVAVTRAQRLDHLEAEIEAVDPGGWPATSPPGSPGRLQAPSRQNNNAARVGSAVTFGGRIDRMLRRPLVGPPPLTS